MRSLQFSFLLELLHVFIHTAAHRGVISPEVNEAAFYGFAVVHLVLLLSDIRHARLAAPDQCRPGRKD
jgi:hypothetical protein